MMVALDPQFFALETESAAQIGKSALTLCYQQDMKTPSHIHDWALSVNRNWLKVRQNIFGSPGATVIELARGVQPPRV